MNRQFRLALFISVAAAVGLHARPCLITCLVGGASCESDAACTGTDGVQQDPGTEDPHVLTAEIASVVKPVQVLSTADTFGRTGRRTLLGARPALRALSSPVAQRARKASWTPAAR